MEKPINSLLLEAPLPLSLAGFRLEGVSPHGLPCLHQRPWGLGPGVVRLTRHSSWPCTSPTPLASQDITLHRMAPKRLVLLRVPARWRASVSLGPGVGGAESAPFVLLALTSRLSRASGRFLPALGRHWKPPPVNSSALARPAAIKRNFLSLK